VKRTKRMRRKISSAEALQEEGGAGPRDPERSRSRPSAVVGSEVLAVELAEAPAG
jgi:hypothetical protein